MRFFDQFKVDKEILKKELESNNINNLEKGLFDKDNNNDYNNNNSTVENPYSNIVLIFIYKNIIK